MLFLAPPFFNYHKLIKKELIYHGWEVDFISDSPTKLYKLINNSPDKVIDKYYSRLMDRVLRTDYKLVFVIKGDKIPENVLKKLKKAMVQTRFICYLWDDIDRFTDVKKNLPYFDLVYTYSRLDSIKYCLNFYPMFYSYSGKKCIKKNKDVSFIGTAHSGRYEQLNCIKQQNPEVDFYFYLFLSFWKIIRKKLFNQAIRRNIYPFSMSYKRVLKKYASSYAILDIQPDNQLAPTTRAVESIAVNSKLITTCKDIANYDFYHPENILIVDKENCNIPLIWIKKPFKKISDDIVEKYNVTNWVKAVILNNYNN